MRINAATMSRRRMLTTMPAAAVAVTGGAAAVTADDPVFAVIERHRQAVQAWLVAVDAANVRYDLATEAIVGAAGDRVTDAVIDWLATQPTTMAGILATLDYAASPSPLDDDRTVLSDWDPPVGQDPGYELVKQFPAMVATALRQIGS